MNWYRVASALIQESLRRGWTVQCWHAKYSNNFLKQNIPSKEWSPIFKYGAPHIVEYEGTNELCCLLKQSGADIVVDVDTIPLALPDYCRSITKKPLTLLLDGVSNPRLQFAPMLPRYDVYTAPSEWHIKETIRVKRRDQSIFLGEMQAHIKEWGITFYQNTEKFFTTSWNGDDEEYYRAHVVTIGTPSLDDLNLTDRVEIRKKWKIPNEKIVVGYLPSPYDDPLGYFWGDLNMSNGILKKLKCTLQHRKFGCLNKILFSPSDVDFVQSLRKFCNRNGAHLVAKLRHSRSVKPYLNDAADLIIGEDGYHPHTALELFCASDVVFGYTSSAALECVASGTPYVDIELPFFPKQFCINQIVPSLQVTQEWEGVVWSLGAGKAIHMLKSKTINDFRINNNQRLAYLTKFTSHCNGKSSSMLLDQIENLLNR